MRLLFTHEQHVVEHDGRYYNPAGMIAYPAMRNYLHTFQDAIVVLRCRHVDQVDPAWPRVDGPGIGVWPIPEFGGLARLPVNGLRMMARIWRAIDAADRHIIRMPGPTGAMVGFLLLVRGRRYGVEMAGHYDDDLKDLLRGRGLGPAWMHRVINGIVRFVVRHAATAAYRSEYLRKLYPTRRADRQWIFSGAQLAAGVIGRPLPPEHFHRRPIRIASIGRVAVGKGYPLLVRVFARLKERSAVPMELEIIGDGDEMEAVKAEVQRLGLSQSVRLPGRIAWGPGLFCRLDDSHLFVLPSLSDGMPRSLIEAMARGMPCISTLVGGIPELLPREYLVPHSDEQALLEKMASVIDDPARLAEMSRTCFERSKEHWPESLDRGKRGFWGQVSGLGGPG